MTEEELSLFSEFLEQKLYNSHKWYEVDDMLIGGNSTDHQFIERDGRVSEFDKAIIQGRGNFWAGQAAGNGARDGGEHIKNGLIYTGDSIENGLDTASRGIKHAGIALGSGIALAGAAGAYSRVKAAKLADKRNKEEAESKYKTSKEDKKKK